MHPQAQLAALYFTTTGTGCSYCDIYTFYGYTDPVHTLHSVISASAQFVVAASNREFQNPVKGSPVFLFTSVLGNFINTEQYACLMFLLQQRHCTVLNHHLRPRMEVIDRVLHSTDLFRPGRIILFDKYI